jgi:uncharacterized membrane protein (UPF0127 family)
MTLPRLPWPVTVIVGSLVLAVVGYTLPSSNQPEVRTLVRIGACTLHVEVADTPARRATGLGHTAALRADGLLLRWPRPALHAIWMRDMRYPLDLAWIDRAHVVTATLTNVAPCASDPCPIHAPSGAADSIAVLETAAGRLAACDARVGQTVAVTSVAGDAR